MKLTINISHIKEGESFQSSDLQFNNTLVATNYADLDEGEFRVDNHIPLEFFIDNTQSATFSIDLFDFLNIDRSKVASVWFYAHKAITSPNELPDAKKFDISLGGIALGSMSQFRMDNMLDFDSEIVISNVEAAATETTRLAGAVCYRF